MNVKALAAIVGTLSLGALATGCASNKAAEGTPATTEGAATDTKGTEAACKGGTEAKGTEAACKGATEAKGTNASCGEGSCSNKK